MNKRSFKDGLQFAWDATSIELAQTCLRKYYYSMILGIRPKRESVHLLFGGIYASALENFYKYRAEGDSIEDALLRVVDEALVASWDFEKSQPKHFDDTKKTRPNLIRTIVWYIDQFAEETEDGIRTYHLQNGKPAVELSFTLEANDEILLCGHLDRVVDMGGSLYVMDQKTTGGTVGTYYFEQFSPNNQMSLYSWAGQAILRSPVRGVIIDAAQIAVNFTRFERGITTRTKDQLDEWYESALYTIELARSATALQRFPMNLSACGNYGGCPFRELCSRSPKVRENFLKSDYVDHNWDPLKAR
ncbi:MAG: PD-(D/E)XK nuclease family protein [Rhodobacteraceae bacterium]|nr:PD-(D/E)XK nuclease family protein [Paracoccaceae bacterium]